MRSVDRPVPTINDHRPDVEPFPAVLHIGIERQPLPVYVWDDGEAFWDDETVSFTWDDVTVHPYQRFDLFCRFHGLTITTGNPDSEAASFEAGHVEMTLDNRDGTLSQYNAAGRLIDWQPGSPLDIWAVYAGEAYWQFSGFVTVWRENADGTLDVEAVDAFTRLNRFLAKWTPGAAGDTVPARLTACCAVAGFTGPTRFATGHVNLLTEETDVSALEAMQQVSRSDGGILGCDADGTVVYRDRYWPAGRLDQETIWRLSDNYCATGVLNVWEAVQTTEDGSIVNTMTIGNIADVEVSATYEPSLDRYGPMPWPSARTDDLWQTTPQGQALADWIVNARGEHHLRLEQAVLYAHDRRQNLWPFAVDVRLGDLIDWTHQQPAVDGPALFAVTVAVSTVIHDITPEAWITTIETSTAIDYRPMARWDQTTWTWDDADPLAVWN
jgi:hypothetical protein